MYCPNCGEQLDDSSQFCPKCGTQLGGGSRLSSRRRWNAGDSAGDFAKDRMMRLVWAIVVIIVLMLFFSGWHYLKTTTGLP
jgi:uncharacterized membrane protein YvbJ